MYVYIHIYVCRNIKRYIDISYDTLQAFVEYLYTDHADINGDTVVGLYMAADKYQLLRLRALCENYMLQNISITNVCPMFQTADQLKSQQCIFLSLSLSLK